MFINNNVQNKQKVYYAHSMLHYGSNIENEDIIMLEKMGYEVINPNNKVFEKEYQETKDFNVFLKLVESADVLAFRSVLGKISMGVRTEIEHAQKLDKPVIELPTFLVERFLTMRETVDYCRPLNVKF